MSIQTTIMKITPDYAEKQLAAINKKVERGEFVQRKLNQARVTRYAREMRHGAWKLTHQGIAFDVDGNLIDGQHRLWAIVNAKVPVEMMVTTNLPKSANNGEVGVIDTLDCGAPRTIGQQLAITRGMKHSNKVASSCNIVANILLEDAVRSLPMSGILTVLKIFQPSIETMINVGDRVSHLDSALFAPLVLYHNARPRKATEFAQMYESIENLPANHPVLRLIKWRDNTAINPGGGTQRYTRTGYCISCLRYFDNDEKPLIKVYASQESRDWMLNLQKKNAEILKAELT